MSKTFKTLFCAAALLWALGGPGRAYSFQPRIGYFSGVFNPPHLGHVDVVRAAVAHMSLDEIVILPTMATSHNEVPAPWEHRLAMARLAFSSVPQARVIGPEYAEAFEAGGTGEAVRKLKSSRPPAQWVHVMGADSWDRFAAKGYMDEALKEGEEILIISRPGTPEPVIPGGLRACVRLLTVDEAGISGQERSSTLVRRRRTQGLPVSGLVSPEVEEYMIRNGLYEGAEAAPMSNP